MLIFGLLEGFLMLEEGEWRPEAWVVAGHQDVVGVVVEESLEVGGGGVGVSLDGLGLPCRVGVPCTGDGDGDIHAFVARKYRDLNVLRWSSLSLDADDD